MSLEKMVVITGGVGCGKTFISNMFDELGAPVFNADNCVRKLQNKNPEIKSEMCRIFGDDVYKDGVLDRKLIANIAFSNKNKLEQLEDLIQPDVIREFMNWKYIQIYDLMYPFVMIEDAVITKRNYYKLFDFAVLVDAPIDVRRERVMTRPGMTMDKMDLVIKNQESTEEIYWKLINSGVETAVIKNDGKKNIKPEVQKLIKFYNKQFK